MASVSHESTLSPLSPLNALHGVGEKRLGLYHKLGLRTIQDLVEYYPRSYLDFSHVVDILDAPCNTFCTLRVRITAHHPEQYVIHVRSRTRPPRYLGPWNIPGGGPPGPPGPMRRDPEGCATPS